MNKIIVFLTFIGLIFEINAQKDPALKEPGMKLQPTYVHAHEGGKVIPAELVLEIQRTGQKSHVPLDALEQATIYRLKTVASTFEDKTGIKLDLEQYLGPENTWHQKLNNPDNGFLVSNRNNPGRKIWTYGWLPSEFTAPDGTVFQKGWYYFDRNLYVVGEKGYTENEGTIDLHCEKLFPDVPEMKGVFIAWYADGCANPSLPDKIPFTQPTAEKRTRTNQTVDPFTGSNWVVSASVSASSGYQNFQPAPQYFGYAGQVGFGYGYNYCPLYVPMFNNCFNCGCCGGGYQQPQNITNVYEGDTYIYEGDEIFNEGDVINEGDIINEGDVVIINNPDIDEPDTEEPDPDDDGGPVLGENGDDDGGPVLGDNGFPVLGDNDQEDTGNNGGGPNLGNGMVMNENSNLSDQSGKTSSFSDIDPKVASVSEQEYWSTARESLLSSRQNNSSQNQKPVGHQNQITTQKPVGQSSMVSRVPSIETAQRQPMSNPVSVRTPNVSGPSRVPTMEQATASASNGFPGRTPTGTSPAVQNTSGNVARPGRVPLVEDVKTPKPSVQKPLASQPVSSAGKVPAIETVNSGNVNSFSRPGFTPSVGGAVKTPSKPSQPQPQQSMTSMPMQRSMPSMGGAGMVRGRR